ncbi:hypothetical protein HY546_01895 [archaeon]|nr:hypothetical protein [archaeon]
MALESTGKISLCRKTFGTLAITVIAVLLAAGCVSQRPQKESSAEGFSLSYHNSWLENNKELFVSVSISSNGSAVYKTESFVRKGTLNNTQLNEIVTLIDGKPSWVGGCLTVVGAPCPILVVNLNNNTIDWVNTPPISEIMQKVIQIVEKLPLEQPTDL